MIDRYEHDALLAATAAVRVRVGVRGRVGVMGTVRVRVTVRARARVRLGLEPGLGCEHEASLAATAAELTYLLTDLLTYFTRRYCRGTRAAGRLSSPGQ